MSAFVPILIIGLVIFSVVSKAKKAEAERRAREAREARLAQEAADAVKQDERPAYRPVQTTVLQPTVSARTQGYSGSMRYDSTEGETKTEGGTLGGRPTVASADTSLRSGAKHVVRATSEGGHTHVESAARAEDCRDESVRLQADHAYDITSDAAGVDLAFDRSSVVKGVLYAEILGRPRSKRPIAR